MKRHAFLVGVFVVLALALAVAGILTLSGSLFLFVYGLIKAPEWGWLDPQTVAFLMGGAVLMGAFIIGERTTADPRLPLDRAALDAALADRSAFTGAAADQVDAVAAAVSELVARYPEAAKYTPGAIL